MSVKKNIVLNGIAGLFSKTVRIADQLILVPFFLTAWGVEYYGEWLTLSIIPSVLAFSDLGFGTSSGNAFVLAYSSGDFTKASNIIKTSLFIITIAVLLGLFISIVAMFLAYSEGLFSKSIIQPIDAIEALIMLITGRLISFYNQFLEALYRSKHKADLSTNIATLEGFSRIGIGIIILTMGYGIVAFSCSSLIVSSLFVLMNAIIGGHIIGKLPKANFDKTEAKSICYRGLGFMFTPLWQAIYYQGSTFVVRIVIGAEGVAVFNTVRTVCRSVNQLYSIVNISIFPEMQIAYGKGNLILVRKIFLRSIQLVTLLAILGVLFLCSFGQVLYDWWTNNLLSVPKEMWYILMVGVLLNALWWTSGCVFQVMNEPFRFAFWGVTSAVISTIMTYMLSNCFGLQGAAIGYVALDVIMACAICPYVFRKLNLKMSDVLEWHI